MNEIKEKEKRKRKKVELKEILNRKIKKCKCMMKKK